MGVILRHGERLDFMPLGANNVWSDRRVVATTPLTISVAIWLLLSAIIACWIGQLFNFIDAVPVNNQDGEGVALVTRILDGSVTVIGLLILTGFWLCIGWMLYRRVGWMRYTYVGLAFFCFVPIYLMQVTDATWHTATPGVHNPIIWVLSAGYMTVSFALSAVLLVLPQANEWFSPGSGGDRHHR